MAQEDGFLLILTDKSSDFLGEGWTSLTSDKESLITVRHQLTMTTGLDDGVTDNHSFLPQDLIYKAGCRYPLGIPQWPPIPFWRVLLRMLHRNGF